MAKFEIIDIYELLRRLANYNHKELHVHHTWSPTKGQYNGSNGIALQEGMRNYHVNTNGWSDIGQHVTLLPDGRFVTGRDFGQTPASILGYNTGAFACETLGNFDTGHDTLEDPQKASLVQLGKFFYDRSKYIRFHRENADKTCPGTSIDKDEYMGWVKAFGVAPAPVVSFDGHDYTRQLQELCNEAGRKDKYGNALRVDGIWGEKTQSAAPVLKKGVTGLRWFVKLLQKILLAKGYKLPRYGADGGFGDETLAAVLAFQRDCNIVADGSVGPITWSKLLG